MATTRQIADEISFLMPVIARRLLMDFFKTTNISQTQIFTIMTLDEKAPCSLSELTEKLKVTAPTVTGIIGRLERQKYVKRVHDKKDRRVVKVDLTAKGRRIAKKLRTTVKKKWEMLLSKVSKRDRENYVKILRKIYKGILQ